MHEDLLAVFRGRWVVAEGTQLGGCHLIDCIRTASFYHVVRLANLPLGRGRNKGLKVLNAILCDRDACTLPCSQPREKVGRSVEERLQQRKEVREIS